MVQAACLSLVTESDLEAGHDKWYQSISSWKRFQVESCILCHVLVQESNTFMQYRNHGTTRKAKTSQASGTDVLVTQSVNRAQASGEMFSNPDISVGRRKEENMFNHAPQKLDRIVSIKRLKALGATTFTGTPNLSNMENWLSLIETCFRVMDCPEERKVKLATFLLQDSAED